MRRDVDVSSDAVAMEQLRRILTQVEESDFERIDPPAGLWEQISAAVASERAAPPRRSRGLPTEPPSRDVTASTWREV